MSKDIDWSKAPEGATHAAAGGYMGWADCWYKKDGEQWFAFLMDRDDAWEPDGGTCGRFDLVERIEQWTGTGLPPVGTVCEIQHGSLGWARCEIVAHKVMDSTGVTMAIAWIDANTLDQSQGIRFRPIRTQAQIEAEEREKEIDAMVAVSPMLDKTWSRKVCVALYDAGYRKQGEAK